MSLPHGSAIGAEQLERVVGRQFGPTRFAALCNAIAWATAGRGSAAIPSFTERVNVADGGIDAEWHGDLPTDAAPSALLGPGWVAHQYKQRDSTASDRRAIVRKLTADLKGALKDLCQDSGRHPDLYVAFTNIDVTHREKGRLRDAILAGYDQSDAIRVEIIGAAELAAMLNDLPHLRSAFFATDAFCTWQEERRRHAKQQQTVAQLPLVGREAFLAEARVAVDDPEVRAIVVSGPQGMGKTRLALEATAHRSGEAVVALDPRSMSRKDLLALQPPEGECIVIIEDPEPDRVNDYVLEALTADRLKLVISLPTVENAPMPGFGQDQRVSTIPLRALSPSDAEKLLDQADRDLDYGLRSWIVDQAGGNPGILLHAASLGAELLQTPSLIDSVAAGLERRLRARLAPGDLGVLRLLSLMTHVGIRHGAAAELGELCRLFGGDIRPNDALNALLRLEDAGLIRVAGSYAEVTPPLLANHLATTALRGCHAELLALLIALRSTGRDRLLRRLLTVKGDEVTRFWDEFVADLFGPDGELSALPDALAHGRLLHLAAQARPEHAARFIEDSLRRLPAQERAALDGSTRAELQHALEELRFRRRTVEAALRCLALLAEGQTGRAAGDAARHFNESFFPLHPQLPLPLDRRLALLRELAEPGAAAEQRSVVIRALRRALGGVRGVSLRSGEALPPDAPPATTWRDVFDYLAALLDLLQDLARDPTSASAEEACAALPEAIAQYAIEVPLWATDAVARLESAVDWIAEGTMPLSVPALSDAIRRVRLTFARRINAADASGAARLRDRIERLDKLLEHLAALPDSGDFATRLRRWVAESHAGPGSMDRRAAMLRALAEEAIASRALTDDLLNWLCSGEARHAQAFFHELGAADATGSYLDAIVALGGTEAGIFAFVDYLCSFDSGQRSAIEARLDTLVEDGRALGEAVALATAYLASPTGIARIERLIRERGIQPDRIGGVLHSRAWLKVLPADDYLRLLRAVAAPQLASSVSGICSLHTWSLLHGAAALGGPLAEFAWQCLEALPPVRGGDAVYAYDEIAATLAGGDPERAFRLLEALVAQPSRSDSWNPLDHVSERGFWHVLITRDRDRALRVALMQAALPAVYLDPYLSEVIDQIQDAPLLIDFAIADEAHALLVGRIITAAHPGFWPIALRIFDHYSANSDVREALERGAQREVGMFSGPLSFHYAACLEDIERVAQAPELSRIARDWLAGLARSLHNEIVQARRRESDDHANRWRSVRDDPDAPERRWARRRLAALVRGELAASR